MSKTELKTAQALILALQAIRVQYAMTRGPEMENQLRASAKRHFRRATYGLERVVLGSRADAVDHWHWDINLDIDPNLAKGGLVAEYHLISTDWVESSFNEEIDQTRLEEYHRVCLHSEFWIGGGKVGIFFTLKAIGKRAILEISQRFKSACEIEKFEGGAQVLVRISDQSNLNPTNVMATAIEMAETELDATHAQFGLSFLVDEDVSEGELLTILQFIGSYL